MLSEIPAGLAEDVVRGKVRLAGGGALLPGLASRIETAAGIGTVLVEDPLRCVVRGAAEILERKDAKAISLASPGCAPYCRYSSGWPGDGGRLPAGHQPSDDRRDDRHADHDQQQVPGRDVGQPGQPVERAGPGYADRGEAATVPSTAPPRPSAKAVAAVRFRRVRLLAPVAVRVRRSLAVSLRMRPMDMTSMPSARTIPNTVA